LDLGAGSDLGRSPDTVDPSPLDSIALRATAQMSVPRPLARVRPDIHNGGMRLSDIDATAKAFAQIDKPNRLLASLTGPSPVVQSIVDQREKQDQMLGLGQPSLLEQIITGQTRQNRLLGNLTEPTAVDRMIGHVERTSRLIPSSVADQILRQQRTFDDLTKRTTLLQALVTGSPSLPSELVGQAEKYRDDLQGEVAEVAAELPTALPDVLERFSDEREAILICLKRIGFIGAAGHYFGVQIPSVVLGLVIVFLVIGEVADEMLTERDEADAA